MAKPNLIAMSPAARFWWSLGRAALFVAIFVGFQSQLSSVISALIYLITDGPIDRDRMMNELMGWTSMIAAVAGVLTIITVLLILYARDYSPAEELGLVPPVRGITLLQAALLGVGACGAASLMLSMIPFPESWLDSYVESAEMIVGSNPVLDVLATVIIAPVVEEIVFRGMVYGSLKRAMPNVLAAIIASVVFGILHGTIVWFVYTALLSMLLIFLYEYTQSLWASILAHMAFNIFGQLPTLFEDGPLWISAIYVYGCVAVFVGVLIWTLKSRKAQRPAPTPYGGMPQ